MGDKKSNCAQAKPRRSFSPEMTKSYKRELRKTVDEELNESYARIVKRSEDPVVQINVLQEKLSEATYGKCLIDKKYEVTRLALKESSMNEHRALMEKNVAEFILGIRSVIERRTNEMSPEWLRKIRDVNLSYRYEVILDQDDNDDVLIILDRMTKFNISRTKLASNLEYFWSRMCLEYHEGTVPDLSEEEMELVFRKLRITDDDKKATIKVIGKGFEAKERASIFKPVKSKSQKRKGFLLVSNVPYSYTAVNLKQFILGNVRDMKETDIKRVLILEENNRSLGRAFVFTSQFENAVTIHNAINGKVCEKMTLKTNEPQLFQ